ncbi:MAG: M48 family metalloprotease [Bacteroidales bacterium]|nr:M48 family metalloprotease [Bacteroidales bacterium]
MKQLNPSIALEKKLSSQIYKALQGSVIESILKSAKATTGDDYWRSNMEGHSLKIEKALLNDLYDLCMEVKEKLGFGEPVDFFVTGDATVNAFSISAEEKGKPHIVNINSSLIGLMTENELRFVIGHELGHLINRDSALKRLIYFVFPPEASTIPMTLQYKIRLHDQLAELVADRYGYMAVGDENACITAFYKLASGLDLEKMNVAMDVLIEENNKRLDYFLHDKGTSQASHPVNPVRVQALHLFANATGKKALENGMEPLLEILMKLGNSPLDEKTALFFAAGGLIVAGIDKAIDTKEIEQIINSLAPLTIFPRDFLEQIAAQDVSQVFNDSARAILELDPGMRIPMLQYFIAIVLADKEITQEEVDLVYQFGKDLSFSEKEISTYFAELVQRGFIPSLDAIC